MVIFWSSTLSRTFLERMVMRKRMMMRLIIWASLLWRRFWALAGGGWAGDGDDSVVEFFPSNIFTIMDWEWGIGLYNHHQNSIIMKYV